MNPVCSGDDLEQRLYTSAANGQTCLPLGESDTNTEIMGLKVPLKSALPAITPAWHTKVLPLQGATNSE
jgi:hypothetical protein